MMANKYADVRRRWREIETQRDLELLWRGERFEEESAIEDALRIYEMAIRVDGWDAVKEWARSLLAANKILNAQMVELAMRAVEQKDADFFREITDHLMEHSPPNYFRFWHTLFTTRHVHFGERLFRVQLDGLSDFHVVKYRRWLRKILRKLRFRCHSDKEKAIGAIVFGMYKEYDEKAYPSALFSALRACHDEARTPKRKKNDKAISPSERIKRLTEPAVRLGIWSVVEGIRTSYGLPRTLTYLAAMAPKMTDHELLRSLRAFDQKLLTANHKKASEEVVQLADFIRTRLQGMEVPLDAWCKIYPYLHSETLRKVFEDLIHDQVEALQEAWAPGQAWTPLMIFPQGFEGRTFRFALLLSYLFYLQDPMASVFQLNLDEVQALCHPTKLWPHGYNLGMPAYHNWRPSDSSPHQILFDLVRKTFPTAAQQRFSSAAPAESYLHSLRYHLHRRMTLDGAACATDIPILFFAEEPLELYRPALETHLSMFAGAVLVLFGKDWQKPLSSPNMLHLRLPAHLADGIAVLRQTEEHLKAWKKEFTKRKKEIERELKHLAFGMLPTVRHIPQSN